MSDWVTKLHHLYPGCLARLLRLYSKFLSAYCSRQQENGRMTSRGGALAAEAELPLPEKPEWFSGWITELSSTIIKLWIGFQQTAEYFPINITTLNEYYAFVYIFDFIPSRSWPESWTSNAKGHYHGNSWVQTTFILASRQSHDIWNIYIYIYTHFACMHTWSRQYVGPP